MNPILEVTNLTKTFIRRGQPDLVAVDHVSFALAAGECLGIIGESGSGKSTVANMVTRLLDPTEGEIILDGENITKAGKKELRAAYRKMQMIFQAPTESFDPRRTLGDGIGESLRNSGRSREEQLIQKEILELLNSLRRQKGSKLSILFISHDIALVQQFCDRLLVMYKGKIVEQGTPDEIIKNPRDEYTKRLIDSIL